MYALQFFCSVRSAAIPSVQNCWTTNCKTEHFAPDKRRFSPVFVLAAALPFSSERSPLRLENVWLLAAVRVNFACKFQSIYNCLRFLKLPNLPTVSLQRLQAKTLVETVTQSGAALLQMCAMILFFRCLMTIAQASGLYALLTIPLQWGFPKNTAEGLLSASLEITALTQLVPNTPLLLALFAALLAFGGICVHLQIFTITGGRLSLCWMLSLRVLAGGLAAGFCWIGCQVFPDAVVSPEICSVSAPAVQYSRTTPIASLFLVGATLLLLQAAAKQQELCRKG